MSAKKLCSMTQCTNEAVVLEPKHLCSDCQKKGKKKDGKQDEKGS